MGWSNKYKSSINCSNPKGFSQKAHCQGKKKRNERIMKLSELKEEIKNVLRERSINAISKLQQKNLDNISKALEFFKKNKHTDKKEPFIKLLKKLGKEKEALAKELDMKVSGMYKNAEYKGESVEESINEGPSTEEKRIAMLAVRKQAKYRNVSIEMAIQDQINALEDLKRDAKRGKLK